MALLDLLGRRWTLRILWELQHEALSFAALRTRCDEMSPSVLNERLRELRESGIAVLRQEGGYTLTPEGRSLVAALAPIHDWATHWGRGATPAVRNHRTAAKPPSTRPHRG